VSDAHDAEAPENRYIRYGAALPDHEARSIALPPVDAAVAPTTDESVRFDSGIGVAAIVVRLDCATVVAAFDGIVVVREVEALFAVVAGVVVVGDATYSVDEYA
jgi:hypothetical protein